MLTIKHNRTNLLILLNIIETWHRRRTYVVLQNTKHMTVDMMMVVIDWYVCYWIIIRVQNPFQCAIYLWFE